MSSGAAWGSRLFLMLATTTFVIANYQRPRDNNSSLRNYEQIGGDHKTVFNASHIQEQINVQLPPLRVPHLRHHHVTHWGPYFENADGQWINGSQHVGLHLGATAMLDCRVAMLDKRTVMWMRKSADRAFLLTLGKDVHISDPRYSVNFQYPNNWRLTISAVQKEDRGQYVCEVNTHPPTMLVTNVTVLENSSQCDRCFRDREPEKAGARVRYKWYIHPTANDSVENIQPLVLDEPIITAENSSQCDRCFCDREPEKPKARFRYKRYIHPKANGWVENIQPLLLDEPIITAPTFPIESNAIVVSVIESLKNLKRGFRYKRYIHPTANDTVENIKPLVLAKPIITASTFPNESNAIVVSVIESLKNLKRGFRYKRYIHPTANDTVENIKPLVLGKPIITASTFPNESPDIRIVDEASHELRDRYYKTGSGIELACIVRLARPESRVPHPTWKKSGEMLPDHVNVYHINGSNDELVTGFHIERAKKTDSGEYTCSLGQFSSTMVQIHVLNGEKQAAVHHDQWNAAATNYHEACGSLFTVLTTIQLFLHAAHSSSSTTYLL